MKKLYLLLFALMTISNAKALEANGHEYVDLGLPSGTLWATCNIGANSPEEYGDYFAWGETEPKSEYSWSTYLWSYGSSNTLTKYCPNSDLGYDGYTDAFTQLQPEDDAATANWGKNWQMPTVAQQDELREHCTYEWTQLNGVNGTLVKGPNGNTIFLPAAGYRYDSSFYDEGSTYGDYWSCSYESRSAYSLYFYSGYLEQGIDGRQYGHTVRPVRNSNLVSERGDVNLDNKVDIADAVSVLNAMAGQPVAGDANVNGDYNESGDPIVDIADLVTVLNIMAGQ